MTSLNTSKTPHWSDVSTGAWRWQHFSPYEMACKGTGKLLLVPSFMDRLQALRELVGPLPVSSGYRSEEHDAVVGGAGVHTSGRAVDILAHGRQAFLIAGLAGELGFTGIGLRQAGPYEKRFVHLDDLGTEETKGPRPWVWTY